MTIFGADLSHYDDPDASAMFSEGIVFMTHKAGGDGNDNELSAWWESVKSHRPNVLLGAYWVLYPGSPAARADSFLARLNTQCPGWQDGPFMLQADCEEWNQDPSTVPSLAEIRAFCDRLVAKAPNLRPIVYAPKWVYKDTLTGLGYPLWASSYVTGAGTPGALYPGDGSIRWNAYSGQTPAILQFTSSATIGGQTTCDANAYRGTLPQLTALLAPGWAQEGTDMSLDVAELDQIYRAVVTNDKLTAPGKPADNPTWTLESFVRNTYNEAKRARLAAEATLAGLGADTVDEQAIADAILKQLTPEAIAGAIPADIAEQVVSLLTARLAE